MFTGVILTVTVPLGDPENTINLYRPFEATPSAIFRVRVVVVRTMDSTPSVAVSISCQLTFVRFPHTEASVPV